RGVSIGEFNGPGSGSRAHRMTTKTWLFWEDDAPSALFAHPSRLLLVSDRSRAVRAVRLAWWPLINGRPPPFLRPHGSIASHYVVYKRLPATHREIARGAWAWNAGIWLRRAAAPRATPPLQVKPSD